MKLRILQLAILLLLVAVLGIFLYWTAASFLTGNYGIASFCLGYSVFVIAVIESVRREWYSAASDCATVSHPGWSIEPRNDANAHDRLESDGESSLAQHQEVGR